MSNFVPVNSPKFLVDEKDNSLKITTGTSTRTKITAYFIFVFFLLMTLGSLFLTIFTFVKNSHYDVDITSMVTLIFGLGTLFIFTRTFEHTMEITNDSITIFEGANNFWQQKKYAIAHIKNLRSSMRTFPRENEGAVKFDYGSQTIIFGKWLTEAEASLIVQAIVKKFPKLKNSLG
jgi:hypothetical protein